MKFIVVLTQFISIATISYAFRAFTFTRPKFHYAKNFPSISSDNTERLYRQITTQYMVNNDDQMEDLLDEMIYSGDFTGFVRRKSNQVLSEEFLEYLQEREKSAEDIETKTVVHEIMNLVSEKIRLSDGMVNGELIFEERLDKILYTAPNKRLQYIEENISDMTDGFIAHIKKQMTNDKDIDNKVVFASILKLISQVKGYDLLGAEAVLLSQADSSLGDQFAKPVSSGLITDGSPVDIDSAAAVVPGDRNEQVFHHRNYYMLFHFLIRLS
jgi:hypothetical protein